MVGIEKKFYRRYREKNAKAEEIDLEGICRDEYNFKTFFTKK